jgi:hypothetical protein
VRGAKHLAPTAGGVVVLGEKLEVLGHRKSLAVPAELKLIAALDAPGRVLGVLGDGHTLEIDLRDGQRTELPLRVEYPVDVFACGGARFFAHWVEIVELDAAGREHRYKLPGHPMTVTAAGDKIYTATKEGTLWEIDRPSGKLRDLGLGGWHGAVSMAVDHELLYVVTRIGKLWEIDPRARTSTIIDMEGWMGTLALRAAKPDACAP